MPSSAKPLCFNRPAFAEYQLVQTGWSEAGQRITAYIPNPMSKDCKQWDVLGEARLKQWDCTDCIWKPSQTQEI